MFRFGIVNGASARKCLVCLFVRAARVGWFIRKATPSGTGHSRRVGQVAEVLTAPNDACKGVAL